MAILEAYPEARDSDKLLWLAYLVLYCDLKTILGPKAYDDLKKVIMKDSTPTMETVRRVRQKIQENGHFQGKKRAERMQEAHNVKSWVLKG